MKFHNVLHFPLLVALALLAGCATATKTPAGYPVNVTSSQQVQIVNVHTRVEPYGLVVMGSVHLGTDLTLATMHSVDIIVTGPDGKGIRKLTSAYYPAPKLNKKKPQKAHFTAVMYEMPPAGSTIQIELTPEPVPDQPIIVNPI